ncbi:MAG TPA: penicillin-binding transpeptidase domain-containing protein, partial [Candidatus Eisenbacteria bacterium]
SVFANQGLRPEPLFVTSVIDKDGVVLEENRPRTREAMDPGPLFVLTDMLESVMNHGTGAKARTLGLTVPVAGKSGTTNDYSDAWFMGYTPDVVTGVWIGFDERKPIGARMSGSVAALPAWVEIMKAATAGRPIHEFSNPSGVVYRNICPVTGLLAREGCPDPKREVFMAGEAPEAECHVHSGAIVDPAAGRNAKDGQDRD